MFFRRETPKVHTFATRLENLRQAGFVVSVGAGTARVTRGACAIDLKDENGEARAVGAAGILMGDEIGALIDGGYQKFFRTPSGRQQPALAEELKALHEFEEDLK